jgi:hypothetical protein
VWDLASCTFLPSCGVGREEAGSRFGVEWGVTLGSTRVLGVFYCNRGWRFPSVPEEIDRRDAIRQTVFSDLSMNEVQVDCRLFVPRLKVLGRSYFYCNRDCGVFLSLPSPSTGPGVVFCGYHDISRVHSSDTSWCHNGHSLLHLISEHHMRRMPHPIGTRSGTGARQDSCH